MEESRATTAVTTNFTHSIWHWLRVTPQKRACFRMQTSHSRLQTRSMTVSEPLSALSQMPSKQRRESRIPERVWCAVARTGVRCVGASSAASSGHQWPRLACHAAASPTCLRQRTGTQSDGLCGQPGWKTCRAPAVTHRYTRQAYEPHRWLFQVQLATPCGRTIAQAALSRCAPARMDTGVTARPFSGAWPWAACAGSDAQHSKRHGCRLNTWSG